MAKIIPFHGTAYDASVVGDITQVVAPPYDIIDTAGQQVLYDRHPQNIIRLELGLDQSGDSPTSNPSRPDLVSRVHVKGTGIVLVDERLDVLERLLG